MARLDLDFSDAQQIIKAFKNTVYKKALKAFND